MAKLCLAGILLVGVLCSCAEAYKSYDNYKVIRLVPASKHELDAIQSLKQQTQRDGIIVDFWREPSRVNASVDIMVGPADFAAFSRSLARRQLRWTAVVGNMKTLIDEQKSYIDQSSRSTFKAGDDPGSFAIDQYHPIDEINNWIDSLATSYPNIVSTLSIGSSLQGRDMKLIKIGAEGKDKPGYYLDAGIHAREWITTSTAVYIINQLVTNATYKDLLDKVDFVILPSLNPDGYAFTWSDDRMWRKTRSGPYGPSKCIGVDSNRNYDDHWGGPGSSPAACTETYEGPSAFSEIENANQRDYLLAHQDTLKAYISLHSYSDLFMYSYAWKKRTYPPDVDELKALANDAADALQAVHGTKYTVGSIADVCYDASGNSLDWAKTEANIKYSYTLELRPGDGDQDPDQFYGFALPPSYIIPVGEETWAGLQVIAQKVASG